VARAPACRVETVSTLVRGVIVSSKARVETSLESCANRLDEDRSDTSAFHRPSPAFVIVSDAPDLDARLTIDGEIDKGIVNCRVAVVIRLPNHAAVDRKSAVAETPDKRKPGVRADEAADAEVIEPSLQAEVVRFRLVEELTGVAGTAVTEQDRAAFQLDDLLIGPSTKPVPRTIAKPAVASSNASQLTFSSAAELYPQPQLFERATGCYSWLPATKRLNLARIIATTSSL
jgi:hypothetical protein